MPHKETSTKRLTGIAAVLVLLGGTYFGVFAASQRTVTFEVNSKERVCKNTSDCKYLIYTDAGVFENTDSLLALKWDSSDVYNHLTQGHTYKAQVIGWRIPFLSSYPNITSVREQ